MIEKMIVSLIKTKPFYAHFIQQLKQANIYIHVVARYIEFLKIKMIIPDETFLEEFRNASAMNFKKSESEFYRPSTVNAMVDTIRKILNEYFYPNGFIKRPLFNLKAYKKYLKFISLSETTQKLLVIFEEDGRCVIAKRI